MAALHTTFSHKNRLVAFFSVLKSRESSKDSPLKSLGLNTFFTVTSAASRGAAGGSPAERRVIYQYCDSNMK